MFANKSCLNIVNEKFIFANFLSFFPKKKKIKWTEQLKAKKRRKRKEASAA